MAQDPPWKRIVGGLCGVGILVAVLLLVRNGGVSAEEIEGWQLAIVGGAGLAGAVLWYVRKRDRR
jgi:hypothetical protein